MNFAPRLLSAVAVAAISTAAALQAQATVGEKVVAVVGNQAIMLSELRQRSRPDLLRIYQAVPDTSHRAELVDMASRRVLEHMIDELLERQIADKQHINVTAEEIDGALQRLALMQNLTVDQLVREALRSGMTAQEYRDELRRQLLDGKLLELRVKGRVRVTDDDMRLMYQRLVREERQMLGYRPQWIVLRIPRDATQQVRTQRRAFAEGLVQQLRAGADFAALARAYSNDGATRELGGDLGPQKPGNLDDPIEHIAFLLDVGQVSQPFVYADAIVILRIVSRDPSRFGSYEEIRDQLAQRVYSDQLEKARRKWLDGMKRGIHIDTRL